MRVLAYADGLEFSGAESAFALLVRELNACGGIEVGLALPPGRLADALSDTRMVVNRLPRVPMRAGLSALDPKLLARTRAVARRGGYDVVLANLPSVQAGTAGLHSGLPSVGFLHIPHPMAQTGFKMGRWRDVIARPRLTCADRIVVPAPSVRRYVTERWGFSPDRVVWAPPPFSRPVAVPRERARAALGLAADRLVLGIAGRLTLKQKGHDVLLDAVSRLSRRGLELDLVVAGAGRDLAQLRSLAAELRVEKHVQFAGAVPNPAVLYGAVNALVMPSRFEGLPLVALEALSLSLPGIASRVDGLADVWPPDWLVEAGNAGALAGALESLLSKDPEDLRVCAAARWEEMEPTYGQGTAERFVCQLELAANSNCRGAAGAGDSRRRWHPRLRL